MSEEDRIVNEILEKNGRIKLARKVYELENIIKEIREKIKEFCWDYDYETYSNMTSNEVKELVEILDKENK